MPNPNFNNQNPLESEAQRGLRKQRMLDFIKQNGGEHGIINFAQYMQEHLYGQDGYFSKSVDISKPGDFLTLAELPVFAQMFYEFIRQQNIPLRDFVELGGGTGAFKREFLKVASPERYVSVDVSPKLLNEQSRYSRFATQDQNILGSATEMKDLPNASVRGVIFANELLDNFPARVFRARLANGRISQIIEIGVNEKTGDIQGGYIPPILDEDYCMFQAYLQETDKLKSLRSEAEVTLCLPTEARKFVASLDRVLSSGTIILCDYGFGRLDDKTAQKSSIGPYYIQRRPNLPPQAFQWIDAIKKPYETDLTYLVDFGYYDWLFGKRNPKLKPKIYAQSELFSKKIMQSVKNEDELAIYKEVVQKLGGDFKVMTITKT
jgi:SAM-dependent MidA family methyltransferase